jgi:hypothetical protein
MLYSCRHFFALISLLQQTLTTCHERAARPASGSRDSNAHRRTRPAGIPGTAQAVIVWGEYLWKSASGSKRPRRFAYGMLPAGSRELQQAAAAQDVILLD